MWADTEIRRDLIRGWRDEAVELWREHYDELPEVDPEDDDDGLLFDLWCRRKKATWTELAVAAMDLELAREIDEICDRTAAEVMIRSREGDFDEVTTMLERAESIDDPQIRAKVITGICFGIGTPAWALDLGLMGRALSIPSRFSEHDWAVAATVETLGRPDLLRWVAPSHAGLVMACLANHTGDPDICRDALERAFLESDLSQIRRSIEAIGKTGDLALNEWTMRKTLARESAGERAHCFAILAGGPLEDWAREFAISTCDEIDEDAWPETFGSLRSVFATSWRRPGWAREIPLAELAITCRDPAVTERMLDREVRDLTLAAVGIHRGDAEPIRRLRDPHLRAQAHIEYARLHRDETAIFEAGNDLKKVNRDEDYLDTLIRMLGVFANLRPPRAHPESETVPAKPRRRRRRRVNPDQLSLPLEI